MTSKERVLLAINHEEPDKVPLDSWMAPEVADELVSILDVDTSSDPFALGKRLGNDFFYRAVGFCEGFSTIYDETRRIGDNLYEDAFGIQWSYKRQSHGGYCEMVRHPLADKSRYGTFIWPDALQVSKAGLEENRALMARDGKQYGIIGAVPCSMLEGAWYLRGLDNFLMDVASDLDFVNDLLDHTMNHSLALSRELVRMGVDILWWGDDFSIESGPIMQPALVRRVLIPRYARVFNELRAINRNIKIAFHCDGKVEWALDDLIGAGVDVINPLQPDANDVATVKKRYGSKLTVWGNVDTRHVMSLGSATDVVTEVKNVIRTLSPGGGHLLSSNHTIQATPRAVENTMAFYWAAHSFRSYPIGLQPAGGARKATRIV
jgi:uroporphyrinogen decarboxylase